MALSIIAPLHAKRLAQNLKNFLIHRRERRMKRLTAKALRRISLDPHLAKDVGIDPAWDTVPKHAIGWKTLW